jgi:hypothetical protein
MRIRCGKMCSGQGASEGKSAEEGFRGVRSCKELELAMSL